MSICAFNLLWKRTYLQKEIHPENQEPSLTMRQNGIKSVSHFSFDSESVG